MCGIVGILNRDGTPVDRSYLEAMTNAVKHRGPDGEGIYVSGSVGIGHRRLAILDQSEHAAQPMRFSGQAFTLSFSGEIYNYSDLRLELEKQGVQFRSSGDTEVVYQALALWGETAVAKFKGMFAIAWIDEDKRELLLARDQMGIKPLYYLASASSVLFASEIKSILAVPGSRAALNLQALAQYLAFQNVFGAETFFDGICEIEPGECRRVSFSKVQPDRVSRFGGFDFGYEDASLSFEETAEHLEYLLTQAVQRQNTNEAAPSVYLSGGLDSSLLAVLASQHSEITAITVGFDVEGAEAFERDADETQIAQDIANQIGLKHLQCRVSSGQAQNATPDIIRHLEDPKMGQSYANFEAARLAGEAGKTVLSGLGADEFLGGYPWRYGAALSSEDDEVLRDNIHAYWHGLTLADERKQLLKPIWSDVRDVDTYDLVAQRTATLNDMEGPARGYRVWRAFEFQTFLRGLLSVDDKLGMAHSVETRFPFLDEDLVEFMLKIPVQHLLPITQMDQPLSNTEGKKILRHLVEKNLSPTIANRKKRGFTGPNNSWYRAHQASYLRADLTDPQAPLFDFLDFKSVCAAVEEHIEGKSQRHRLIWSLLSVNQWCREFLG